MDAQKPVQESAHATRGALCAQPDANVQENVTSTQVLLQHQLATNTIEHNLLYTYAHMSELDKIRMIAWLAII